MNDSYGRDANRLIKTLQRGIDRGELPADCDLDLVLDSLYGPIYMRFLIRHDKLEESFADAICGLVLQGLKGSSHRRPPKPFTW